MLGGFTFYFGMWTCVFGSGTWSGSIYLNNIIASLLQCLTAPVVGFAINSRLGRRGTIILFGFISFISVILGTGHLIISRLH